MGFLLFVPLYIRWHYYSAPRQILRITENFAWFLWHFFSIGLLLQTFFLPWQRLQESTKHGFDIGAWAGSVLVNIIMRLVGIIVRGAVILSGLVTLIGLIVVSAVFLAVWFALPLLVPILLIFGAVLMIKPV